MSRVSPCVVWASEDDLPDNCDLTAVTPDVLSSAFGFACDVLYNLTKRRWPGLCTDTYRPFSADCCYSWRCGLPSTSMSYELYHDDVRLPAIDVRSIDVVMIDGVAVPADEYGVRDGKWLYSKRRADGSLRVWPCYNDLHRPATAGNVDTFLITYSHGADPPASMVMANALLAWEFALAWTPDCAGQCRLPKRVTTITRAGMTIGVIDPLSIFDKGLTGVPDIDILIQAVNRGETNQRAFVGRPGMPSRVSRP